MFVYAKKLNTPDKSDSLTTTIRFRTDVVARPSRTGRHRDNHPAGHRTRGRGARVGVRVHGGGGRAGSSDGRFRDDGWSAGHRAAAGPASALPGNVYGATVPAAAGHSSRPETGHGRGRRRRSGTRLDVTAAPDPAAA